MSVAAHRMEASPGDWLSAHSVSGGLPRRGEILEVIGPAGHERFRVRWDEAHESIVYPADGITIERPRAARRRRNAVEHLV